MNRMLAPKTLTELALTQKKLKRILVGIMVVTIFLVGPATQAIVAQQEQNYLADPTNHEVEDHTYPGWDLSRTLAVVYDPSDKLLTTTGYGVFQSLSLVYSNIEFVPVQSWQDLKGVVNNLDYYIKAYFIKGGLDGIEVGEDLIVWSELAKILGTEPQTHHIFGSGATNRLEEVMPNPRENVRIEGSDIIDAQVSFSYTIWEIAEILSDDRVEEYREAGQDVRDLSVIYFAENMNELLNAQVEPKYILGEEDVEAKKELWDKETESWNELYQIMPDGSKRYFNETSPVPRTGVYLLPDEGQDLGAQAGSVTVAQDAYFSLSEQEKVSGKVMGLLEEVQPFTIADIPLFSGLEGPVAGIVDAILNVLITQGGSKIGLDPDVALEIANILKEIGFFISDTVAGGGDAKTTVKALISRVVNIAPVPAPLKLWLPLIVDAIFLYDSDPLEIIDFAKNVLVTVFNQTGSLFNSTGISQFINIIEEVLLNGVDLGVRLIEDQNAADAAGETFKPMDSITGYFFEKIMNFTTFEFIAAVLGETNSTVLQETGKIMQLIIPLVNAFISGDLGAVIDVLPDIIDYLADKASALNLNSPVDISFSDKQKSAFSTIGRFFQAMMTLFDQFSACGGSMETFTSGNIRDIMVKLVQAALPMLDLSVGRDFTLADIVTWVGELFDIFATAANEEWSTRSELLTAVKDKLSFFFSGTSAVKDLIAEILTTIGSLSVSSLPLPKASDFRGLAESLLNLLLDSGETQVTVAGKTLSPAEVAGLQTSETTKETFFIVLDTIFGILALNEEATAAQFLFLDDFWALKSGLGECTPGDELSIQKATSMTEDNRRDNQLALVDIIKNSTNHLIRLYLGEYLGESMDYAILFSESLITTLTAVMSGDGNSIMTTIRSFLMQAASMFLSKTLGIQGDVVIRVLVNLFSGLISGNGLAGVSNEDIQATAKELITIVDDALDNVEGVTDWMRNLARQGIEFLFNLQDLFTDGISWIFQQLESYIISALSSFLDSLLNRLVALVSESPLLSVGGSIPFKGADALGLKFNYQLDISLNLEISTFETVEWIYELIFKGGDDLDRGVGHIFQKLFAFITFKPVLGASFEVAGMSSAKGGMVKNLMSAFNVELSFSGKAWVKVQLFSIKGGVFDVSGALKVLEWGFGITIGVTVNIPLLELIINAFAPGAGTAIGKLAKYIGLDAIVLKLYLNLAMEIFYKAASEAAEAVSKLTLSLTIGCAIYFGFDFAIVGIGVTFGVEFTITFIQDLLNTSKPYQVFLDLVFYVKVELTFLFFSWDGRFDFRPPGSPWDVSPKGGDELEANAFGTDRDRDGLGNSLEEANPFLDPDKPDTDGDGLGDKYELRVSKTAPNNPDTDGDGLTDFAEWMIHKTDPFLVDTDFDGLSDYEEVVNYLTSPFAQDTDGDRLTDWYEIHHELNMTGIDPSVKSVTIGGVVYTDRTDPLDPDTDDDGLIDGEEDVFGPYFGNPANYYHDNATVDADGLYVESTPSCVEDNSCAIDPLFLYNKGYTHPLDNDTDDDSYWQHHDGAVYYDGLGIPRIWGDLSDGAEINGILATVQKYDPVRGTPIWVTRVFYTNPVNPDSDGDTGVCASYPWGESNPCQREPQDPNQPFKYLNSDGRELFAVGTDPLDPDSDSDGLIDGLEGTLLPTRDFTTNPFHPDSDGDGLPDGLEFTIGTYPDNPDSDGDLVLDGDEFYLYHTDPMIEDTDYDGVSDGWELFFSHSNPHSQDSDLDGLSDYQELFIYATDPVDEDTDNDDLTDRNEVFTYGTDPTKADTDNDGLRDGEEIFVYGTNPFDEDTDGDGITYLNERGEETFPWTDGQEVEYGTDPTTQDTDFDGILDSWELYIATGSIPHQGQVPIDPLNNDTDGDGIIDGREMIINRTNSLIYPYVAYFVFYPLRSSPVSGDTDGDGLGDLFEFKEGLHANNTDTDGDGLTDWDELYIHLTDPRQEDTDGDGLSDSDELTAATQTTTNTTLMNARRKIQALSNAQLVLQTPAYQTSASDPDSDNDGWPDGLEINATDGDPRYDPYNADVNSNGVPDGYERDYDNDGISDGDEYYTYQASGDLDGGFLSYKNPDSDFDGLMDGEEILTYGTKPFEADSDGDGYSDSLELFLGTDPLSNTTEHVFLDIVGRLTSPLRFVRPEHNKTFDTVTMSVEILNLTALDSAWVRYREIDDSSRYEVADSDEWSENISLKYGHGFFGVQEGTWSSPSIKFENGKEYELQVFGLASNYTYPTAPDRPLPQVLLTNKIQFLVDNNNPLGLPTNFFVNVGLGVMFILVASAGVLVLLRKRGASL